MSDRDELDPLWADRSNWRFGVIYFCRHDPRVVVPKRYRKMGWTMNFARPMAVPALALIIGIVAGTMALSDRLGLGEAARLALGLGLVVVLIKALGALSRPIGRLNEQAKDHQPPK